MSLLSEAQRILGIRNNIRSQMISLNMISSLNATLADCNTALNSSEVVPKRDSGDITKSLGVIHIPKGYYNQDVLISISEYTVSLPSLVGSLSYNGTVQSPEWNTEYDPEKMTISGDTSNSEAGVHTVTFTPNVGYHWADGTRTTKELTWVMYYVWLKWNINISYNDSIETKSFAELTLLESNTSNAAWGLATSFSFDSTTGKYTLSEGKQFYGEPSSSIIIAATGMRLVASGLGATSNIVNKVYAPSRGRVVLIGNELYGNKGYYDSFLCDIHTATEIHSKGQTQYSNVSDIDINAYPTIEGGAEQGRYWYIKTW